MVVPIPEPYLHTARTLRGQVMTQTARINADLRLSYYRLIVKTRLFFRSLQLEDNGPQAVVATTNGHAGLANPVSVVEQPLPRAVGQGKGVLIDRLPCLVTEALRLGVVGVKDLPLPQHGTGRQPLGAVFLCQRPVQGGFQNGNFTRFITIPPRVRIG